MGGWSSAASRARGGGGGGSCGVLSTPGEDRDPAGSPLGRRLCPQRGPGSVSFLERVTKWLLRVLPSLPPLYLGEHVYRATPTAPRHPPEQPGCIHDVPNIREKTGWGRGRLPSSLLPLCSMSLRCLARTKWKDLVICVHGRFFSLPLLARPRPLWSIFSVSEEAFSEGFTGFRGLLCPDNR